MEIRAVCFDLGGVMIEIAHTWGTAADVVGVPIAQDRREMPFLAFEDFDTYQAGAIDEATYARELGVWLGCRPDQAIRVHDGILMASHPGMAEVVHDLKEAGFHTGCLSNTNALHWTELTDSGRFPEIAALDLRMASHLIGRNKPDPEAFRVYADAAELPPGAIAYFDDFRENVEGALAVGFRATWIDHRNDPPAQMRTALQKLGVIG